MIYIENEEHRLVKYEVKIDDNKLYELRNEITVLFGKCKHKSYKSQKYCTPITIIKESNNSQNIYINNFQMAKIEHTKDGILYCYEYDEYVYPELARLINEVLQGKEESLIKIKNGPITGFIDQEELDIKKEIMTLSQKPIENSTLEEINDIKNKIKEYQKKNKDTLAMKEYYTKTLEYMTFTKLSAINKNKLVEYNKLLREINHFFGKDMCYNDIDKILKK